MNNEQRLKIKNSINETRKKHSQMLCKVFEVKIVSSKLSCTQKSNINQLFKEAKWLYNDILNSSDIFKYDTKVKSINVKVKDEFENRELEILSGQQKRGILDSIISSIKGLSTKKKKGQYDKVGKLKFKSVCNSIPLKQYGKTYDIDFSKNKMRIQGIKGWIKVRGLDQIKSNYDICNANFIRKASGLYLHITCYIPKYIEINLDKREDIGIDFGISNNLTLSNGKTYDINIFETKGLKLAQRRFNRYISRGKKQGKSLSEIKSSKQYWFLRYCVQKAYEKLVNIKHDLSNKVLNEIFSTYNFIAIQDELIHNWHSGLFGNKVQHSCMGLIKEGLKKNPRTYVIPSSYPSTQLCPICGGLTKHGLDKREYHCEHCGYHHDNRDIKAAETILSAAKLYNNQVSPEQRAQSPVKHSSSTKITKNKTKGKKSAKSEKNTQEAFYALA